MPSPEFGFVCCGQCGYPGTLFYIFTAIGHTMMCERCLRTHPQHGSTFVEWYTGKSVTQDTREGE